MRDADDQEVRLYVNGNLVDFTEDTTGDFDSTSELNLGWLDGGFYFDGTLDEVAIYGRALSDAEVVQHYYAGLKGSGIEDLEEEISLLVLAPNGGEIIPSGAPYTINWFAPAEAETTQTSLFLLNSRKMWILW